MGGGESKSSQEKHRGKKEKATPIVESVPEPEPEVPQLKPVFHKPVLDQPSELLDDASIEFLCPYLPTDHKKNWTRLFNSNQQGKSFNRFCYHVVGCGPNLVIIKDSGGAIFGGFCDSWRDKNPKFYGQPNSFVFTLAPERTIYRATGRNDHYQYLNWGTQTLFNGVGQGGDQDYFAWGMYDDLDRGQSRGKPNVTYNNPVLASKTDFDVDIVEVWELHDPPDTYEFEKIRKKKNKKSVLEDEDNADKVIANLNGHTFSDEQYQPKDEEGSKH